MKISIQILIILIIAITLGCGDKNGDKKNKSELENKELSAEEREEKALYDELMAVHDEAMPKMDNIMRLKRDLKKQLDTLMEKEGSDSLRIKRLTKAINKLEAADEGMMQWMRDFEPQNTGDKTHEEKLAYYEKKKASIEKVSKDINNSIKEAKKLREK